MTAEIKIWDTLVGYLAWDDDRGYSRLSFDSEFLRKGWDLSPLDLPLSELKSTEIYEFKYDNRDDRETYKELPSFVADSLPDAFGNTVINAWLRRNRKSIAAFGAIERLCYTGTRGLGALEYFPALYSGSNSVVSIDVPSLVELASEVLSTREALSTNIDKGAEALVDILRVGSSAGGSRPKVVIAINDKTGEIKSGQIAKLPDGFQHWLLKLDGVTGEAEFAPSKGYGRVEYAYYKMCIASGINMAECRLLEEDGRAHFMTRRFDRPCNGEKLHMLTLNGIALLNYNRRNANSYEEAFATLNRLELPYLDKEQLFRRMVFNVVGMNCDDHTKNISFLMDRSGKWSLAPAYDMTYSYNPDNVWLKEHLMSVNGKFDGITRADLECLGKLQSIKKCGQIIDQIVDTVCHWSYFAKDAGVDAVRIEKIGRTFQFNILSK